MKIGMLSTLSYPVPPEKYGGIELVVYYLVEGLIKRGHEVVLFAPNSSKTSAKLNKEFSEQIIGDSMDPKNVIYSLQRINYLASISDDFDIIHNHDGFLAMAQAEYFKCPLVNTWHVPIGDDKKMNPVWRDLMLKSKIISISNAQRKLFPNANYIANVYNGTTDMSQYTFGNGEEHLIWIGRFDDAKGSKEAIAVAKKTNNKIVLAGKVETDAQKTYFEEFIEPEIDNENVIYLGQIGIEEKVKWLGKSKAFLMPIKWEEPFGLVVTEANACGTPVIAFARGSMPEIIKDEVNGFLVEPDDLEGMANQVEKVQKMEGKAYQQLRESSRLHVEQNFSIDRMVEDYIKVYESTIKQSK